MSDNNDALDRAVKALRETGETSPAEVARTRMRVMETIHRGERRSRRTFWVLLPIAAVLAGSTALAKNSEIARRVWTDVAETIGIASPAEKLAPVRPANEKGLPAHEVALGPENGADQGSTALHGEPSAATADNAAPAVVEAPARVPPGTEIAAPGRSTPDNAAPDNAAPNNTAADHGANVGAAREPAAPRRPRRSDVAARPSAPAPSNSPPEVPEAPAALAPSDGEAASLELYKNAYRLHFVEQRYAAALAAWDEYLRAAPKGRLVVEARYNRAIALVRLGRRGEAETALTPFAHGEVNGGYRAREARELLDALNVSAR